MTTLALQLSKASIDNRQWDLLIAAVPLQLLHLVDSATHHQVVSPDMPCTLGGGETLLQKGARKTALQAGNCLQGFDHLQHAAAASFHSWLLLPLLPGDCGRIMTSGTLAGNVIASQLLGWPAGQLYKNIYSPS